jgi:Fe-Mn family superoxide dismutase
MDYVTRRDILGTSALLASGLALGLPPSASAQNPAAADGAAGPYTLPPLPYDYADLEPHIDAQTMKLHHDVHHDAYVKGANKAIAELERIRRAGGDEIRHIRAVTDSLAFNGAGHVLHTIFWNNMKKNGGGEPASGSEIANMITRDFGSFNAFQGHFSTAAVQVQGSGWALLTYDPLAQRLLILQAEKHDNLAIWGTVPLLVLDVWEHAYYLRYQNRRAEYIKAFFNVINWTDVNERLLTARKLHA